jgi:hypothetical protein
MHSTHPQAQQKHTFVVIAALGAGNRLQILHRPRFLWREFVRALLLERVQTRNAGRDAARAAGGRLAIGGRRRGRGRDWHGDAQRIARGRGQAKATLGDLCRRDNKSSEYI